MKPDPLAECSQCGKPFMRRTTMQSVCSPRCAIRTVKAKRAQERAELRQRRDAAKPRGKWLQEAQASFNAFVRARDRAAGYACICCGEPLDWGAPGLRAHQVDCGHYRSTGSAPHLRFCEDNAHAQRVQCNRYGAGRAVDYRIGLIARIGLERVEALEADQTPRKYAVSDLREIRDEYRAKLKELQCKSP